MWNREEFAVRGSHLGAGEAQHFLAFSRLSLNESGNPLSSWLGAPVFGGALQLFISQRRTAGVGIKAEIRHRRHDFSAEMASSFLKRKGLRGTSLRTVWAS